jgi:hypothetical protein
METAGKTGELNGKDRWVLNLIEERGGFMKRADVVSAAVKANVNKESRIAEILRKLVGLGRLVKPGPDGVYSTPDKAEAAIAAFAGLIRRPNGSAKNAEPFTFLTEIELGAVQQIMEAATEEARGTRLLVIDPHQVAEELVGKDAGVGALVERLIAYHHLMLAHTNGGRSKEAEVYVVAKDKIEAELLPLPVVPDGPQCEELERRVEMLDAEAAAAEKECERLRTRLAAAELEAESRRKARDESRHLLQRNRDIVRETARLMYGTRTAAASQPAAARPEPAAAPAVEQQTN